MGNGILLRLAVGVCCALAVFGLSACTPHGAAVGDTQQEQGPAHDNQPGANMTVALIGAPRGGADGLVADALDAGGFDVAYTSTADLSDPVAAAGRAVLDAVARRVRLVMLADFDFAADADAWDAPLRTARAAGVPVVLLDADSAPDDELYAAALRVNDRMLDAMPIGEACDLVIRDEPHERDMTVTTIVR